MSRQTFYRCDRCMVAFDPLSLRRLDNRYRVISPALDGEMDLCEPCLTDLEAWVRFPLEERCGARRHRSHDGDARMTLHDDRTIYDSDRADRATREEAEACVEAIDAMRQRIREFVRTEANLLALTYPRCVDLRDMRNPSFPLQVDEAIEGFVEIVDDAFGDLLDGNEVTRLRNIAENGYD